VRTNGRDTSFTAAWRTPWTQVAVAAFGVAWGAGQFAPLLLVYRDDVHLASGTISALWIIYVVGLIPAMLLGGYVSDRSGRRPLVRLAICLSFASSVCLMAGSGFEPLLFLGRLLAGVASGAAYGPATAWIKELSGDAPEETAARRAAVAISLGFGGGPLLSGFAGAWLPAPDVIPFVLHATALLAIIPFAWSAPEAPRPTAGAGGASIGRGISAALRRREFLRNVLPTAPWVFGTASTVTAVLPEIVIHGGSSPALAGAVSALTLGSGVVVQPLGKQLEARRPGRSMHVGLLVTAAGFGLGILTVALDSPALLFPSSIVFGSAYGLLLVAGLVQVEILAEPGDLASLTAVFYCLTYVGFAAPLVFTLAEHLVGDTAILVFAAVLALVTVPFLVPQRPRPGDGGGRGGAPRPVAAVAR
jgi:MFS family permease